ncbi:MAG: hypothetical protein M3R69_04000 [Acidobacteriota bacterium]|nr:hypothetical protein [Acidobacteriota bacterium]
MKTDTICADMACDHGAAERPRYYARQLITSDDLTLEQDYFRSKLRLHNRMLHGWGVVCGAQVCMAPKPDGSGEFEPWQVYVKPGYILGPCGDEINIDCGRVVNLRAGGTTGVTGEPCVEVIDPWCVEVFERDVPSTVCVAVRYKQFATRPVRVQPIGCGCDDTSCENSRWRDGYEIKALSYCPHDDVEPPPGFEQLFVHSPIPPCPIAPDDPWVGLAKVELDADGVISRIDNCACRRMVLSHASFWWHCEGLLEIKNIQDGGDITEGEERVIKAEAARAFPPGTKAELGVGVTVKTAGVKPAAGNDKILEIPITIEPHALVGPRALTITYPDSMRAVYPNAINIKGSGGQNNLPPPPKKAPTKSPQKGGRKTASAASPGAAPPEKK